MSYLDFGIIESLFIAASVRFNREDFAATYAKYGQAAAQNYTREANSAHRKPGTSVGRNVTFSNLLDQDANYNGALDITYMATDKGISTFGPQAAQYARDYSHYHASLNLARQPLRVREWHLEEVSLDLDLDFEDDRKGAAYLHSEVDELWPIDARD
jgi:hypothetical protein